MKTIVNLLKERPPRPLPPDFADHIVALSLTEFGTYRFRVREWAWWRALVRPRQVLIRPAWQLAWVVALCVTAAAASAWLTGGLSSRSPNVWVRFAIQAPQARQVSLVGDFNAWQAGSIQLEDPDGDGVWHAVVPMNPGVYQYMFVLDGDRWIADPLGDHTVDDGFGQANSLLKVAVGHPDRRRAGRAL